MHAASKVIGASRCPSVECTSQNSCPYFVSSSLSRKSSRQDASSRFAAGTGRVAIALPFSLNMIFGRRSVPRGSLAMESIGGPPCEPSTTAQRPVPATVSSANFLEDDPVSPRHRQHRSVERKSQGQSPATSECTRPLIATDCPDRRKSDDHHRI